MKKSLIALAVLGSVAGAAQAQSNVTLYGIVDLWVGSVSNTNAAGAKSRVTQMTSGGVNGSRWGMKGSEDLGGGLKAVFQLESGFNADTGTSAQGGALFGRQANVGVEGGFGTVTFGNVASAMDDITGAASSSFDSALYVGAPYSSAYNLYNGKPKNAIKYVSPSFGGFSGGFSHSLKEANPDGGQTDFSLSYGAGPIAANLGYEVQRQAGDDLKITMLNGSYDLGVVKLLASYDTVKQGSNTDTDFHVGVNVPLSSALTVSAGYAQNEIETAASIANVAAAGKYTGFGAAAAYTLSKRTMVYGGLRSNKAKSTSVKQSVFAVGLNHKF